MHLANTAFLLEEIEQNLVSWSRERILQTKGKTMLDLSNSEILGSYIWIFFQWLEALGDMVINQKGHDNLVGIENLTSLRKHWHRTQCCRYGGMDEEYLNLEESKSLEAWDRMLIDFEDLAFPSRVKNRSNNVINIYAKPSISHPYIEELNEESLISWEPWMPSTAVKRSLKELMAVIMSTL